MSVRRPLLALAALLCLAGPVAVAQAHDSHAPKGARADWLPSDEWVMSSWLPFDEARLYDLLDSDRAALDAWLNDKRTLAAFARRHGRSDTRALAGALVAPRLRTASSAMHRTLRARAMKVFTQPHLANHVFFHIFHTPAIRRAARSIFRTSSAEYVQLRNKGWSPARIGAHGGASFRHVRGALHALFVARGREAVRLGAISRAQAKRLLAEQDASLAAYVSRRYRTPQQQMEFLCRPH